MAEIKGITIVIDGDTTKLDKALRDINKNAAAVGRELTSVSRLLKMSPGNTTLITQKQKMLSDAVSTTSKKLEDLKDAQSNLTQKALTRTPRNTENFKENSIHRHQA
jgi:phage-related minor tail protein